MARSSNNEREYGMDYTPEPPEPSIPKVKMGRYQLDEDVIKSIKPVKLVDPEKRAPYDPKAAAREDARYARDKWAGLTTKEAMAQTERLAKEKKERERIAKERAAARKRQEAQERGQRARGTYRAPEPARAQKSKPIPVSPAVQAEIDKIKDMPRQSWGQYLKSIPGKLAGAVISAMGLDWEGMETNYKSPNTQTGEFVGPMPPRPSPSPSPSPRRRPRPSPSPRRRGGATGTW